MKTSYLPTVTVEYPKYGRVTFINNVSDYFKAVFHVVSPALDGVHCYIVVFEVPGFREFSIRDIQTSKSIVQHDLCHFSLHHFHSITAGFHNGLHFIRMEEVTPQSQAYA